MLVVSLALCLWGFIHPYARLGFSLLPIVLCANYKMIAKEWRKGIPKWVLIPWAIVETSACAHLIWGHTLNDIMGLLLVSMVLGVYLLSRTMTEELKNRLAWLAIIGSAALIIHKAIDIHAVSPGILGLYHSAAFAILIGIVCAPKNMKMWAALIGIIAIAISGSEEGLAALVIVLLYWLFTKQLDKRILLPLISLCLIAIPLLATGWIAQVYPNLNLNRLNSGDMEILSHNRWSAYADLYLQPDVWILGKGWYLNSAPSTDITLFAQQYPTTPLWQTIHNAPLKIATQFGIMAALAWLVIFLTALFKSNKESRAIFLVILCFAFLDHFMWDSAIAWCFALLGIAFATKETYENQTSLVSSVSYIRDSNS